MQTVEKADNSSDSETLMHNLLKEMMERKRKKLLQEEKKLDNSLNSVRFSNISKQDIIDEKIIRCVLKKIPQFKNNKDKNIELNVGSPFMCQGAIPKNMCNSSPNTNNKHRKKDNRKGHQGENQNRQRNSTNSTNSTNNTHFHKYPNHLFGSDSNLVNSKKFFRSNSSFASAVDLLEGERNIIPLIVPKYVQQNKRNKVSEKNRPEHMNYRERRYPFYYVVPDNPAEGFFLPSGTYLVIPQDSFGVRPLNIRFHPSVKDCGNKQNAEKPCNKMKIKERSLWMKGRTICNFKRNCAKTDDFPGNCKKVEEKELEESLLKNANAVQKMTDIKIGEISYDSGEKFANTSLNTEYLPANKSYHKNENGDKSPHVTAEDEDTFSSLKNDLPFFDDEVMADESRNEKLKIEEKINLRMAVIYQILPDADPDFLAEKIAEFNDDETLITEFISDLLETQKYPKNTIKDVKLRQREKLWKYYITDFKITNFLEKVPNPEEIFLTANIGKKNCTTNNDIALKYLKNRYSELDAFQLSDALMQCNESIVNTCAMLDKNYLSNPEISKSLLQENFDELFLQEISFIAHKDEILNHVEMERNYRQAEIVMSEINNTFLECDCCFEDKLITSEAVTCPEGHISCRNCFTRFVEISFSNGSSIFPCLTENCGTAYTVEVLKKFLNQSLFSKIMRKRTMDEIIKASLPDLETCPACEYAYIPAAEDKIFVCKNEECLRETCRLCKEESHIPFNCKEVERPKDLIVRKKIEEAMSEKLIRCCPNCKSKFIKTDGCNKITCHCGTSLCYICGSVVKDYSHFNGLGGSNFVRCPLFTNNYILHVRDVKAAGEEMKRQTLLENPDIHFVHDPTK